MLKKSWFILVFSGFLGILNAQKVEVTASLDSTEMTIGDQVKMSLKVVHAASVAVHFPETPTLGDKFEILHSVKTKSFENEMVIETQDLTVTAFDSGLHVIPSLPVSYEFEGTTDTAFSNPLRMKVNSVPIDTTTIAPIKDIIQEPISFQEDILPTLLIIIGIIIILGIGFWLIKNRQVKAKETVIEPPVVKVPAHEIAFRKLTALQEKELWQKGDFKGFQTELSYILREYLENRFEIKALESTTEEIKNLLPTTTIETQWQQRIITCLSQADLVKFAKQIPQMSVHQISFDLVLSFVETTQLANTRTEPEHDLNKA